jgi:replicative DNA helicase
MESLRKLPPQAIEAEESVLSACLLGCQQEAIDILLPTDFYRTAHSRIYETVCELHKAKSPVDTVTVIDRMRSKNSLDECGGAAYLSRLIDTVPAPANIESYCKLIKEKSVLRQLIAKSTETISACLDGGSPDQILDTAQSSLLKLDFGGKTKSAAPINEIMNSCIDSIEEASQRGKRITGIPTGFTRLDAMTAGLQFGEFTILAARPSMGKTALAMQIAKNACANGYPTMVFSLEMAKKALGTRMISTESRIEHTRVRVGYLKPEDWQRIAEAASEISSLPMVIDDEPDLSIMEMRRRIRKGIKKHGIRFIVVDYLQLMQVDKSNKRLDVEYGDIGKGIKNIAKEFDLATLILCQLNRNVENRSDKHPIPADLKESGGLEQDADLIAFIYRDEVYNKDENNPLRGTAELIISKQRNGPTGTVPLTFLGSYMRFENPA